MRPTPEIVITGIGVVSPIGIGTEAYWTSLCEGRSGIRRFPFFAGPGGDLPVPLGGEVANFDPKRYVRPRKSLKVMSRDIQLAFAAADLAFADSSLDHQALDPDRYGIVFGADLMTCELPEMLDTYLACTQDGQFDFGRWGEAAMSKLYPLWMLKYLPNMPACHIGIAQDARGPNNTITMADVSSLLAIAEAVRVLERGQADVMLAGGTGCQIHPAVWTRARVAAFSRHGGNPQAASRPFDALRDGWVNGEGSAALVLEPRRHAEARGAKILARILGCAAAFEPVGKGQRLEGRAIRQAIEGALRDAELKPGDIGHVNAHGLSTPHDDRIEARAICDTLGDVPVTAPKSFFGNARAGAGAIEIVASILALLHGLVPPTLNYEQPDPQCPVNIVHSYPVKARQPSALVLNHSSFGQAAAAVLSCR
jgi:3-oxoacyl-[acyl-carrier-protein] synthase II